MTTQELSEKPRAHGRRQHARLGRGEELKEIAAHESTSETVVAKTLASAVRRLGRAAVVNPSSTPGGSGPVMAMSRLAA